MKRTLPANRPGGIHCLQPSDGRHADRPPSPAHLFSLNTGKHVCTRPCKNDAIGAPAWTFGLQIDPLLV